MSQEIIEVVHRDPEKLRELSEFLFEQHENYILEVNFDEGNIETNRKPSLVIVCDPNSVGELCMSILKLPGIKINRTRI